MVDMPGSLSSQPGDFPGNPVVRTQRFDSGGLGSIPGQGTKIPYGQGMTKKLIK